MNLLVISTAALVQKEDGFYAYGPYIKEMNIWAAYSDTISFVCPVVKDPKDMLLARVNFPISKIYRTKDFNLLSVRGIFRGVFFAPYNLLVLFVAMVGAGHIHLRCPGNLSLMGCLVQIFFPLKKKTAKYAGNWDMNAKQPLSYRLQKQILSNTWLTRNMQVMVYGEWEKTTVNIKPFFTASYFEKDKIQTIRSLQGVIRFVFVGTLSNNKNPLEALLIVHDLMRRGLSVSLDFYGEGQDRRRIEKYIEENNIKNVTLHGNSSEDKVKLAYQDSHFLLLPSDSEGWPKVVAEAMFWGCIPAVSPVSCVPYMLGEGSRGILLSRNIAKDAELIEQAIRSSEDYFKMSNQAMQWSRMFTMEEFENQIKSLLK